MRKRISLKFIFLILAVLGISLFSVSCQGWLPKLTFAAEGDAMHGWAWSENIGWISFNSLNPGAGGDVEYGVDVSWETGNFQGYAWSENVGWIDFSPSGPYPKGPNRPVRYLPVSGNLNGWARIVSLAGVGKGWISARGPGYGASIDENGDFQGYAWSEDFGWINFNGPTYKVTAKPSDLTLTENEELTTCSTVGLTWTESLGADGYSIWRNGENVTPIAYCKAPDDPAGCTPYLATNLTDSPLDDMTDYSYFIRAYNFFIFTDSNILDLTTSACQPSAPRNFISVGECPDVIRLYWEAPARPGTSYNIYRKLATDASYPDIPLTSTTDTFYEDHLPAGFGYTWFNYRLVAVGIAGEGDPAETSEVPCSECN